jgi:hypothetical protein
MTGSDLKKRITLVSFYVTRFTLSKNSWNVVEINNLVNYLFVICIVLLLIYAQY